MSDAKRTEDEVMARAEAQVSRATRALMEEARQAAVEAPSTAAT